MLLITPRFNSLKGELNELTINHALIVKIFQRLKFYSFSID